MNVLTGIATVLAEPTVKTITQRGKETPFANVFVATQGYNKDDKNIFTGNLYLFGKKAEYASNYIKKLDKVCFTGKLVTQYDSNRKLERVFVEVTEISKVFATKASGDVEAEDPTPSNMVFD